MKKLLFYIAMTLVVYLGFKMTEPYLCDVVESQVVLVDSHNAQVEMFLSASKGDMALPHLVNSIFAPVVHFTSTRKIQKVSSNSLILKRLQVKTRYFGFKKSPQLLCCFTSHNDLFVVLFRRLII